MFIDTIYSMEILKLKASKEKGAKNPYYGHIIHF